jgi:hypothetical protein
MVFSAPKFIKKSEVSFLWFFLSLQGDVSRKAFCISHQTNQEQLTGNIKDVQQNSLLSIIIEKSGVYLMMFTGYEQC